MGKLVRRATRYTFNIGRYRTRVRAAKREMNETRRNLRSYESENYPLGLITQGDMWRRANDPKIKELQALSDEAERRFESIREEGGRKRSK